MIVTNNNLNTINPYFLEDVSKSLIYKENIKHHILKNNFTIDTNSYINEINRIKTNPKINILNDGGYYKNISPSCLACRNQAKHFYTIPVTLKCNRNCFFCPIDLNGQLNFNLNEINEAYKSKNGINYFAISGGEPLLEKDKTFQCLEHINDLNNKVHTRVYTNGDLLDNNVLNKFKKLKVDEIRLSIKQEDLKDLNKLKDKINLINNLNIIIEMPVFPDDFEIMKKLLDMLETMNIKGINLLELYFYLNNDFNNKGLNIAFSENDFYDIFYQPFPIAKSSLICWKLIEYATIKEFSYFVHHCTVNNSKTKFENYYYNSLIKLQHFQLFSENNSYILEAVAVGHDAIKLINENKIEYIIETRQYPYIKFNPIHIKDITFDILLLYYTYKKNTKILIKTAIVNKNNYQEFI